MQNQNWHTNFIILRHAWTEAAEEPPRKGCYSELFLPVSKLGREAEKLFSFSLYCKHRVRSHDGIAKGESRKNHEPRQHAKVLLLEGNSSSGFDVSMILIRNLP